MTGLYRGISRLGVTFFWGFIAIGCQPNQLPNNAVLHLSPTTKTIVISEPLGQDETRCLVTDYPFLDIPYVFSLRDTQGSPIGDVPVSFYADWTGQSNGTENGLLLIYDFNEDGVADPVLETVSTVNDGVFERKTQQFSGEIRLTLRLNLSCPYRGELVAFSGGHHTSAEFVVGLEPEPEPEPEPDQNQNQN